LEGGETGEGPVCACDFEVFGEVFTDWVEVFAIVEG
jgi:hypothetical protein